MRSVSKARLPYGCGSLTLAIALLVLAPLCPADATDLTYLPGGLTLTANQSVSVGQVTLQMKSDCVLVLSGSPGQPLWQSGAAHRSCSSPEASFDNNGELVVSSMVNGQRTSLWASHTSGSSELVLSQSTPFLAIVNSDGSPAWLAVGPLTLESIDPAMVATIGARGGLYSRYVAKRPAFAIAAGDRVDNFQAADGDEVQVLVKAPAPMNGDVYHVPAYPMTPKQKVLDYLSGAIAYATGSNSTGTVYARVVFPPATYEVEDFPGCDEARGANGYNHWQITNVTDLTIDGQGSTLNFNGLCRGIEMDWVQRIVFTNFNLDWPKVQLAGLGIVQKVNPQAGTMELVFDSKYQVDKNTVMEAITSWDRKNNYWSLTNPAQDESFPAHGYTKYLGGQRFEVPDWAGFQNGDTVIARYFAGEAAAVVINDSFDVDVDDVNVYGATSSAFQFSFGRGFRLAHSHVVRAPGRLISLAGDAVHITAGAGNIIVEGNTIGYQGDDGLNLNAWMWCNSATSGSNAQPCNPSLAGPSGGPASSLDIYTWWENIWHPGDQLIFLDPNLSLLGRSTIQSVVTNGRAFTELNFSGASPAQAQFAVDLRTGGARYIIRNNMFLHNRARGVLLQTSEGLVEGNTFDGQTLHSIYVISSPFWGEGPGAQNLTVANNRIVNAGNYIQDSTNLASVLGAVVVAAEDNTAFTIPSAVPLHQNLIFSDNTIEDVPGPGFFLSTTNNVIMRGNHLVNTNQSNAWMATYGTATSSGSIVLTQASNVFFQGNAFAGSSGPVSVDQDSTSGITGLTADEE
ncbi:MAG TPA: right-handed parallel beta-helix repeat-containing protein [Terriglobales bacterium]|nr:right-handed parallel beta-helix repeat-containing protein [Terriglobales bacterium]